MKRSSTKSQNKSSSRSVKRIDFKPNTVIYKKSVTNGKNQINLILDIAPRKINAPTIEANLQTKRSVD